MKILAIDPGNEQSAYVCYYDGVVIKSGIEDNGLILYSLGNSSAEILLIEMVANYGMPVGKSIFDTCVWIGRYLERWKSAYKLIYRHDVKMHLCANMRAKDCNIRQALIDKFPPTGGGKIPQIGTKKKPGPLYGISKDIWSALAVAVTFDEQNKS